MMIEEKGRMDKRQRILMIGLIVLGTIISAYFRITCIDYTFSDYTMFLSPWIDTIRQNGYMSALAGDFYNYTPLYMYVLTLIAKLDANPLYAIKIVSFLFEYLLAFYIGRIAYLNTKKEWTLWLPFAIVPLVPSFFLNSTLMSQCDAIYVSFVIGSVYYVLTKRPIAAMIFLGVAFSLKLQAAFVLPFYFVYMLRGHIKWYMFAAVPLVYFVTVIPAWVAGRPLVELLMIYGSQSDSVFNYTLAASFPNVYLWIHEFLDYNKWPGMIFMTALVLVGGYVLMNKKYTFTANAWIALLFLSAIVCPFFLPYMHERYLYMGDLAGVLYILNNHKKIFHWFAGLSIIFVSYFSCAQCLILLSSFDRSGFNFTFLKLIQVFPWQAVGGLYLVAILYVVYDLCKILKNNKNEIEFPVR